MSMTITIVSWNINRGRTDAARSPWASLDNHLHADVALLQESPQPPAGWNCVGGLMQDFYCGTWIASNKHTLEPITEVREVRAPLAQPYTPHRPGISAAATVNINGVPLTLVSLYGLMNPGAHATMHRHLADIVPLLNSPAHYKQLIVAGDLNLTSQWADANRLWAPIDRALLSQFTAWGLRDMTAESTDGPLDGCTCEDDTCRHVQTWKRQTDNVPRQNDYMFVASRLQGTLTMRVDASVIDQGISDHAALVLTIEG
jgi:endonuclease/exonuclease/phosphatase family metal-dependent hydrolase